MKLKFTLTGSGRESVDLVATVDASATVGDLAAYLARTAPPTFRQPTDVALSVAVLSAAASSTLDPRVPIAESGLHSGSTISLSRASQVYADPSGAPAAVATVVDGPDIGKEFPLHSGTNVIGRERGCEVRLSDPLVSRQHARINVSDTAEVVDLGSANGLVIGDSIVARLVLPAGETVRVGDSGIEVRLNRAAALSAERGKGSLGFIRSPRLSPRPKAVTSQAPAIPDQVGKQRFPLIALIAPILVGAVLFLITRSATSIIFVALSPIFLVGIAVESRISGKSAYKKALAQWRNDVAALADDAMKLVQVEIRERNFEHPALQECLNATRSASPLLWTRRPSEDGFLELKIGSGRQRSRLSIDLPNSQQAARELIAELDEVIQRFAFVDGVPIVARPAELGAVGFAGPRSTTLAAVRSFLTQAATLHSPAELVIVGIASTQSAKDWDWLKWLPHSSSPHSPVSGNHLLATAAAGTKAISELEDLISQRAGLDEAFVPAILVLIESDAAVEYSRLVDLAERGWHHGVFVVWVAPEVSQLPAACRTFIDLTAESHNGAVGYLHTGELISPTDVEVLDEITAAEVARRLAPLVDVGARIDDDSDLPRAVSLLTLSGSTAGSDAEAVLERWTENRSILTGPFAAQSTNRQAGTLRAVIGQAAGEPLALDLRTDGPHALVGGTTGSGKSELLQSWILALAAAHSPQRLTFLLVDYKGGSAFRDCTNLPHTIGLVTDLSPHLVRRALTSLSAELRYREHVLGRHGAKDLITLERMGVPNAPPSLVIVVDEFAALVNEVPEFVDGVVNVAQRGRSLGLHLILATQRPAGVIKDNLRANTNLRVALRMADEADSADVLGSTVAAFFDQSIPGRAVSKTGPGRLVPFQAGYAGGWTSDEPQSPELVVEELVFGQGAQWVVADEPDIPPTEQGETDITKLVGAITRANNMADLAVPRKPWLAELKSVYDLANQTDVPSRRRDTELVFGISDDPDNQAQPTVAFCPDRDGNLAVYGTGGSGKSTLLRTLAVAAGFTVRGGPCHVYGIDFGARGLAMLEDLAHVGSIISGSDHERLTRLIGWLRALIDERSLRYSQVNAGTITDYRKLADAPDEPRILLLVDGIAAFRQAYETTDRLRWFELFASLATDGRPVGVHIVLSSEQRSGMSTSLAAAVQSRVVMRLATDDEYGFLGVAKDVLSAASPPGRGLLGDDEVQVAVLGGSTDVAAQALAIKGFAESMLRAGVSTAPPIQRLAENVPHYSLPKSVDGRPTLGVASSTLQPVGFEPRGTFIVAGPPGSGKTTTLLSLVQSLRAWNSQVRLYYLGNRRSSVGSLDVWARRGFGASDVAMLAVDFTAEVNALSTSDAPIAIFVENAGEFVSGAADAPLADLAKACLAQDQLLVVEGETNALSGSFGFLGAAKTSRAGLALAPDQGDGTTVFRTNFPRLNRLDFPPGRALRVALGKTELVQIGYPDLE